MAETQDDNDERDWCVFSTVAEGDRIVRKGSTILPATYVREFGPATYAECERHMGVRQRPRL